MMVARQASHFLRGAIALLALTLTILPAQARAAAGDLDPSFSRNGRAPVDFGSGMADGAFDITVQPDGKIVAAGYSNQGATGYDFAVVRFNPDGGLDEGFSDDGRQTIDFGSASDDWGHGVAIQGDGDIVVVGSTDAGGGVAVARLLADGELDPSFSDDGRRTMSFAKRALGNARAVAIGRGGKIVVAGESFSGAGSLTPALARFHADGRLDRSFSGDGRLTMRGHHGGINPLSSASAGSIAIQRDGKIAIAVDGVLDRRKPTLDVARFRAKGKPDRTFSHDGRRTIGAALPSYSRDPALAVQRDGRILASAYLNRHRTLVARLNTNGAFDHSFSDDGRRRIRLGAGNDMALLRRAKIVLVGKDRGRFAAARVRAGGKLDHSFSGDGRARIAFGRHGATGFAVAIQGDKIVVGGLARRDSTRLDFAIARLSG
jgi:uncharacterized delta-60 repeat protein